MLGCAAYFEFVNSDAVRNGITVNVLLFPTLFPSCP